MNQPNNVNLDEWQVYADYCFDNNLNEQRARNIIKAIKSNKIYLYLCFPKSMLMVSAIHRRDEDEVFNLSPGLFYDWETNSPEDMGLPICPFKEFFMEKFKDFPTLIVKYFDKLAEIGKNS